MGNPSVINAEDAAHRDGDLGYMLLAVRQDTAAALAGTDGDYIPLITDASGRLHCAVGAITPGTGASSLGKAEDAAHASGDVGVMALAVRADSAAATGGDGDYVPLLTDASGRLHVAPLVAGSAVIGATQDAGTAFTVTRTYTTSADMQTAAAISPAPTSSEKLYALDIIFSTDTAMLFEVEEETSATVFAAGRFPANCGWQQLTPRGELKTAVADKKFFGDAGAAGNVHITCITRSAA